MAFDAYLYITTIEGESTSKVTKPAGADKAPMEIYSFSFGASNPVTISSAAAGSGGGKVALSSFNVMKKSEKSSALLFAACAKGTHFDKAIVVLRKAGGDAGQSDFLRYTFSTVFIESIQWSGSSGGDDSPTESLSIAFGAVKIEYLKQDKKTGATTADQVAMWSNIANDATETV